MCICTVSDIEEHISVLNCFVLSEALKASSAHAPVPNTLPGNRAQISICSMTVGSAAALIGNNRKIGVLAEHHEKLTGQCRSAKVLLCLDVDTAMHSHQVLSCIHAPAALPRQGAQLLSSLVMQCRWRAELQRFIQRRASLRRVFVKMPRMAAAALFSYAHCCSAFCWDAAHGCSGFIQHGRRPCATPSGVTPSAR